MKLSIIATRQDWVSPHLRDIDQTAFHALYVADHPSFETTDAWSWLAYAAGQTERIHLGTHVTGASFHHPTRLAKQVVTVDQLSGGRAILGIGTGYEVQDYAPYGFAMPSFEGRVQYMEETITIIKALFSGRIAGFSGDFFTYEGEAGFAPLPVRKTGIPIIIGLNKAGPALDVAARHAQGINTWQLSAKQVQALREPLEAACTAAGRTVSDMAITSDVLLARDATKKEAEALALQIRNMARDWGRAASVTDWGAGGVLYGDGEAMVQQLGDFTKAGVSEVTVAVSSMDELVWLNENVAATL